MSVANWAYIDWSLLSSEVGRAARLAGPVAAVAGAAVAVKLCSPASPLASPIAPRVGWTLIRAHLSALVGAWTLAFVVGVVPAMVVAAVSGASYGGPVWLTLVTGVVGFAVFPVLGYLIGVLLPLRFTPHVVVLVALLIVVADQYIAESVRFVLPVWGPSLSATTAVPVGIGWLRLLFVACVPLLFAVIASSALTGRRWHSARPPAHSLLAAAGTLGLMAVVGVLPIPAPQRMHEATRVCTTVAEDLDVCVHPVQEPLLEELAELVDDVIAAIGGRPEPVRGVFTTQALAANGSVIDPSNMVVGVSYLTGVDNFTALDLASSLAGLGACYDKADEAGLMPHDEFATVDAVSWWMLDRARPDATGLFGAPPEGTAVLAAAGDQEVAAWYQQHAAEFLACEPPPLGEL